MPGVWQIEREPDPIGEVIGVLGAHPLADHADHVAVVGLLGGAEDLGVWQSKSRQARA